MDWKGNDGNSFFLYNIWDIKKLNQGTLEGPNSWWEKLATHKLKAEKMSADWLLYLLTTHFYEQTLA